METGKSEEVDDDVVSSVAPSRSVMCMLKLLG